MLFFCTYSQKYPYLCVVHAFRAWGDLGLWSGGGGETEILTFSGYFYFALKKKKEMEARM